eukprot:7132996-Ditylum_brightwellii.AAC.1
MIDFVYTCVLERASKKKWKAAATTVSDIFCLSKYQHHKMHKIFDLCDSVNDKGVVYDGSQFPYTWENKCAISKGSVDLQMVGNIIERGGNHRDLAEVLNHWHQIQGQDPIAHSTIKNHFDSFTKIKKKKTQKLAIRYRQLDPYTVKDPPMPPSLPDTKEQWITLYHKEEEEDCQCLNCLTE